MALRPTFNVVTEPVSSDLDELTALEFFRACTQDTTLNTRLTVTDLDRLLLYTDNRTSVIRQLHTLLKETGSVKPHSMIQFIVNGRLFNEEMVMLGVPTSKNHYEDIGIDELFVAPLKQVSATQYVATK